MGSKRILNYTSKPSSCLIYVCCHGRLLIALNLASNFGRTIFGWVGPVLASKTSPAGPNYVDQTWSGRTDFFPGPIFSLQYNSLDGAARRPISHTCDATLELSVFYKNYVDFCNEFKTFLNSTKEDFCWRIDAL